MEWPGKRDFLFPLPARHLVRPLKRIPPTSEYGVLCFMGMTSCTRFVRPPGQTINRSFEASPFHFICYSRIFRFCPFLIALHPCAQYKQEYSNLDKTGTVLTLPMVATDRFGFI